MTEDDAQMEEGWRVFAAWRDARQRAGDPLPPSAVCLLTRETITAAVCAELAWCVAAACRRRPEDVAPAVMAGCGMVTVDVSMLGDIDEGARSAIGRVVTDARLALDMRLAAYRERRRGAS